MHVEPQPPRQSVAKVAIEDIKRGPITMCYDKPEILISLNTASETQQTGTVEGAKAPGQYLDHAIPPICCTVSAYQADE